MSTSGEINFLTPLILIFCLGGLVTDLWRHKVYNAWVTPFLIAGLALAAYEGHFGDRALGLFLGFSFLLLGYRQGHVAAGDIKFLMTLGALGGAIYVFEATLLGILLGGVWALVAILTKKTGRDLYLRIQHALFKVESFKLDEKSKLPFAVPLAVAGIWVRLANPFAAWGLERVFQ